METGICRGRPGLPGFDLSRAKDNIFVFDYKGTGSIDCLLRYRADSDGTIAIVER